MMATRTDDSSAARKLWIAVIVNCWRDAFVREDASLENSDTEPDGDRRVTADVIRGDARRWLCSDITEFREDREEVCDLADIDAVALQRLAIEKRDSMKKKDEKRSRRTYERTKRDLDCKLERLADNHSRHSAKMLDLQLRKLAEIEDARL